MAARGPKPRPTHLRIIKGTLRKGAHASRASEPVGEGRPEPPDSLTEQQRAVWDAYIATAWWLSAHDAPKAHAWVVLYAEFRRNPEGGVAKLVQMRVFGTELGFDPRARMGGDRGKGGKYFE
jgi:hypothetical protein